MFTLTVSVTVELPASGADAWREASELQAKAEADAKRASALRRTAVKELLATSRLSQKEGAAPHRSSS